MDSVLIQNIHMHIPDTDIYIYVGDVCTVPKLGPGNWTAWYGWYTPENSHPVYGWFFLNEAGTEVFPIKFKYFDGIEVVAHTPIDGSPVEYAPATQYTKGQLVYKDAGTIYQATQDFTSSDTGDVDADLAADVASGYLVLINEIKGPMFFKGSLGTGGTIESLPAASEENNGYTYMVITAGTYQGVAAEVGDMLISNGTTWVLIPSGDEPSGTVTNVAASSPNSSITITGSPITTTGTIGVSFTPPIMTQAEYDLLTTKDSPIYFIYEQ